MWCTCALTRLQSQVEAVLHATYTHSRNLAAFVVAYKALSLLMREVDGKTRQYHAFIAAFIGGLLVFGRYNKINEQVSAACYGSSTQNAFLMTCRPLEWFATAGWVPGP